MLFLFKYNQGRHTFPTCSCVLNVQSLVFPAWWFDKCSSVITLTHDSAYGQLMSRIGYVLNNMHTM